MVLISDVGAFKRALVKKLGNKKWYYPQTVPRSRERTSLLEIVILLVLFSAHCYMKGRLLPILALYGIVMLYYLAIVVAYRLRLFVIELDHKISRYNDQTKDIIHAAFFFHTKTIIVAILSSLYLAVYITKNGLPDLLDGFWFFTVPFLYFFHVVMELEDFPLNDSLNIEKDNALDYGSGMAYSFFYGYLNYMLTKVGDPGKDLKEMMEEYESKNQISFAVKTLFILIPKSLRCFESVKDCSKIMDMPLPLPEKRITVAGVRDRVYKNSVYKINDPNVAKPVYVCAEYATPLKTFMEVANETTAHTGYYNRHKNDILLQFYLTMKRVLKDTSLDSTCEVIYYEDKDPDGKFYDIGKILMSKIVDVIKEKNA